MGSKAYKVDKYADIKTKFKLPMPIQLFTVEVTSLGFVHYIDLKKFFMSLFMHNLTDVCVRKLGEISLRCSYFIFCCRQALASKHVGPVCSVKLLNFSVNKLTDIVY